MSDNSHLLATGRFVPGCVYVVSVYPMKTTRTKRYYGTDPNQSSARITWYQLPACPKGTEPIIYPVYDGFQNIPDVDEPQNQAKARLHIIPAYKVADDIVHEWTGSIVGTTLDAKPGIGIWAAQGAPSAEFVERLHAQQDAYFQSLYYEGQGLANNNKHDQIRRDHREAAKYLGRDEKWAVEMHRNDTKACVFCTTKIPGEAIVCPNCHQVVDHGRFEELREERLTAPTAA